MTPDVIWCDFGGVLTPPIAEAAAAVERASGVPWPVLLAAAERVAADAGLAGFEPLETARMSQSEWGRRVTAALPPGIEPAVDLGRFGDYWYRDRVVDHELLAVLSALAADGIRIGMLTNSVLEWEPHRARLLRGVSVFDAVVRSHEVRVAKPDRAIFALADARLPPRRHALLIDDSPLNCEAARAVGWDALHHADRAQTLSVLRSFSGQPSGR